MNNVFQKQTAVLFLMTLMLLASASIMAGTGGTEFNSIFTDLTNWTEGTLGRIIALGMIMVGLGIGVVKQSIMGVVVGIGGGLVLSQAPNLISNIVGATI